MTGPVKYFQSRVGWQSIHPETCVARYFPLAMRSGVRSTVIVEGGSTLEYFKKRTKCRPLQGQQCQGNYRERFVNSVSQFLVINERID
jgi:hypothetical protein